MGKPFETPKFIDEKTIVMARKKMQMVEVLACPCCTKKIEDVEEEEDLEEGYFVLYITFESQPCGSCEEHGETSKCEYPANEGRPFHIYDISRMTSRAHLLEMDSMKDFTPSEEVKKEDEWYFPDDFGFLCYNHKPYLKLIQ